MTAQTSSTECRFEPPGPGSWQQDPVHFPRPMTRYFQETHPAPFKRGTNLSRAVTTTQVFIPRVCSALTILNPRKRPQ